MQSNQCFITRLLVPPVLIIFEGLCPELSAGCSNCTVTVAGEWQAAFSYRQKKKILTLFTVNLQLPDAPPPAYRSYRIVWFKETRSWEIFVSKYHSILQDTRYILGRTLFLRSGVAAMYGQRIVLTVLECCFNPPGGHVPFRF